MIDVTSVYQGITTPLPELTAQIENLGWELGKVSFGQGVFTAEAKAPHGEKVTRTGVTDKTAVANVLLAIIRKHKVRNAAQHYGGMWAANWTDKLPQIAEAYAKAPVYDPKAASAWKELAQDSVARHRVLEQQLTIKVVPDPEPYASAKEMADDIHKNQNFLVSNANCEHPIWSVDENVSFRVVHDVLGHAVSGGDFGWLGENLACAAHFPLLSETAQQALFVECIMQTGYAAYYRSFGPQKVFLPDEELFLGVQQQENPEGHTGVHPSQSIAPTSMPTLEPSPSPPGVMDKGYIAPHMPPSPLVGQGTFAATQPLADPRRQQNPGKWWNGSSLQIGSENIPIGDAWITAWRGLEGVKPYGGHSFREWLFAAPSSNHPDLQQNWYDQLRWLHEHDKITSEQLEQGLSDAISAQGDRAIPPGGDNWQQGSGPASKQHLKRRKSLPNWTASSPLKKLALTMRDPNHGWESGHAPQYGGNAYTDMQVKTPDGRLTDPLDSQAVMDNASLIDSKWYTWTKEDGSPDREKMRHAIVNAFRVVLLSPRKDLRWNAVHYQDISHIPGDELDPAKYWDALEKSRQEWNVKHHGEEYRYAHLPFKKLLPKFNGVIFQHYPHMTMDAIHKYANELIYEWRVEEEHRVLAEDEGKASDKQKKANDVENKVNKGIEKRIKNFIADSVPAMDFDDPTHVAAEQMGFDIDVPTAEPVAPEREQKYGAFMGTHLNAIAQVSEHSDVVLDAALEDVKDHDATGHHFRAAVLQLGISGVGPKVCSFAWLLLMPTKSQLGTIDTHMMDVLGHNYEKEMSTRDYFKFERELQAGRDASGYGHVPLGAFQWGMWDYKRTGPGTHQDHSAMAVYNPTDHHMIDWKAKTEATQTAKADWIKNAPWWWKQTEDARKATAEQFDAEVNTPQTKVPFKVESMTKKTEARQSGPIPWLVDGQDIRTGKQGQTYASFIRETLGIPAHEYWKVPNHALGRFHPVGNFVEVANGKIDQSVYDHLMAVLSPYNSAQAVA